jgi:hypothetical protein
MSLMNIGVNQTTVKKNHQFTQTFSLSRGMKKFGEKGCQAAVKEMEQLYERIIFDLIHADDITTVEKKCILESLIFLTEKRDGTIKCCTCANGSIQRGYIGRDEAASPTGITESIILTAVIYAKEGRDLTLADVPNAFVQSGIEPKEKGKRVIRKI